MAELTEAELGAWVRNRYYYQTRIPIKDAIILSKSDDPAWRRKWMHRIVDHDGTEETEGGLSLWLRLAEAVGLPPNPHLVTTPTHLVSIQIRGYKELVEEARMGGSERVMRSRGDFSLTAECSDIA